MLRQGLGLYLLSAKQVAKNDNFSDCYAKWEKGRGECVTVMTGNKWLLRTPAAMLKCSLVPKSKLSKLCKLAGSLPSSSTNYICRITTASLLVPLKVTAKSFRRLISRCPAFVRLLWTAPARCGEEGLGQLRLTAPVG